jgi:uncharacterized protein (TIGR00661 family)
LPENFNIATVLIAPLDWGLGHATRCIPLIRALHQKGLRVYIGAEGAQAVLLQKEFPQLTILPLEGYRVRYSKYPRLFAWNILFQLPRISRQIKKEHQWLETSIKKYSIDLVISDNRYGLFSRSIPCVFITHQLSIQAPVKWMKRLIQKINYAYIRQFTACWIPDRADEPSAAGELSHPELFPDTKVHYMGLLSRFEFEAAQPMFELCILLSGPEPQRSMLEKQLLQEASSFSGKILLVRGKPGEEQVPALAANITVANHLEGKELVNAIRQTELIICRSGYTTVMELLSLQKKAILIPTPGQTEQEYLAGRLEQQGVFMQCRQSEINLKKMMAVAKTFPFKQLSIPVFNNEQMEVLLQALVKKQ